MPCWSQVCACLTGSKAYDYSWGVIPSKQHQHLNTAAAALLCAVAAYRQQCVSIGSMQSFIHAHGQGLQAKPVLPKFLQNCHPDQPLQRSRDLAMLTDDQYSSAYAHHAQHAHHGEANVSVCAGALRGRDNFLAAESDKTIALMIDCCSETKVATALLAQVQHKSPQVRPKWLRIWIPCAGRAWNATSRCVATCPPACGCTPCVPSHLQQSMLTT